MTHDEMIAVIQAHRDGKAIQFCGYGMAGAWDDVIHPDWDFANYEYRIKPEPQKPREWWIERMPDGEKNLWTCPRSAVIGRYQEIIHVREVLPEPSQ